MRRIVFALFLVSSCNGLVRTIPRPVRVLVGFPPGGGMDTIARVLAPKLGEALGQQFVIENRPGASGGVAAEALAGAQPRARADARGDLRAQRESEGDVRPAAAVRAGGRCACCRWRSS